MYSSILSDYRTCLDRLLAFYLFIDLHSLGLFLLCLHALLEQIFLELYLQYSLFIDQLLHLGQFFLDVLFAELAFL